MAKTLVRKEWSKGGYLQRVFGIGDNMRQHQHQHEHEHELVYTILENRDPGVQRANETARERRRTVDPTAQTEREGAHHRL